MKLVRNSRRRIFRAARGLRICMVRQKAEPSADAWTRAHSEWLRLRDVRRAARCTFWLVLDLVTRGERAKARGWLARTQHLLEDAAGGCAEQGLLLALTARLRIHEKDIDGAHDAAARAADLARRFDDSDLQVFSRLCFAQVVATRGDAAAATALFDEIMVAVTVGDVSPIGIGTVHCAVIEGCHALLDLGRAREWTEALSRWCDAQPDLWHFAGYASSSCGTAATRRCWSEATAEAERACEWCNGAAFYQLAELHRLRGKFAEADLAYRRATRVRPGTRAGPSVAVARARSARRSAGGDPPRGWRAAAAAQAGGLAACVEIMIDGSELQAARAAANELTAMTALSEARYLRALNAQATGSLLLAEGDAAGALRLSVSLDRWRYRRAVGSRASARPARNDVPCAR